MPPRAQAKAQGKAKAAQCRSGHTARARDAVAVMRTERDAALDRHVREQARAVEAAMARRPMRGFDQFDDFLAALEAHGWQWRPILVIEGGTFLGKTDLALDVLRRVAAILQLPSFFEMTVKQ